MDRNEKLLRSHGKRQSGATMVEYIMIVAIIAIALIGAWQSFGDTIAKWLKDIETKGSGAGDYRGGK